MPAKTPGRNRTSAERAREFFGIRIRLDLTISILGDDAIHKEIADWVEARHDWRVEDSGLPEGRTTCCKTFERLCRRLDPAPLGRWFIDLAGALAEAIDGKTLRGSSDHAHRKLPIHLVRAWDHANGLMLGQIAVADKSHEITAAPALLSLLDRESTVVRLDAMHSQTVTAKAIRDAGADDLLAVKKNQPTRHEDLKPFIDNALRSRATRGCGPT
jgi:hypothetical protein